MKPGFFLLLVGYLIILVSVGVRFSRKMKNLEDFFLASRSLSALLITLSLTASWFGASSILVTTDEALRNGVSAFWLVGMPAVLTVLLFALLLAGPIRRLPIISLPDLVELRYGRSVRHMAAFLIIWYMVVLASSQMVAIGQFLKLLLGGSYFWSLALGTACVLSYSILGGLFSVVMTDVLQCLLLGGGIAGLFAFLSTHSSWRGVSNIALQSGHAAYFDFFFDLKRNGLITLSFVLAWTISPIVWQRIQAARSYRVAQGGLAVTGGVFVILYGLVVLAGMLSLPFFPSPRLENPMLTELIASRASPFLGSFLFIAVVAAILSTMDTAINTGALALTRDVFEQVSLAPKRRNAVAASRLATLIVGALAFLVATRFQNILKTLGLASEIMAEGLFVPGMAMIFWKKRHPLAGMLSLLFGGGFALASFLSAIKFIKLPLPSWPFTLPYGVGLSLAGFFMGFVLERVLQNLGTRT